MTFAARCLNGGVVPGASITPQTAFNYNLSGIGGTATASYQLNLSGVAYATNVAGTLTAIPSEWLTAGTAGLYEARGTWQGGLGTTGGPTGWNALNATRTWTLTVTNNIVTQDLLVEIRLASSGVVLTSAMITFDVDSAP